MSGTNDKKDLFNNKAGRNERRQARDQQERQASKKRKKTAIIVAVILALLFGGALFINSNYIRRSMPAVTIDGVEFSAAEYDYFFMNVFAEYQNRILQTMGNFALEILPQPGIPLRDQIQNTETGETWLEFIDDLVIREMSELVLLYNAARAYGYVMREESMQEMDEMIDLERSRAAFENMSFNTYLQRIFGRSMNEETFLRLAGIMFTANSFAEYMSETFSYTPEALNEFYEENRDLFDNFTYRIFLYSAELQEPDDFPTTEEFEAAREEALNVARQQAQTLAGTIGSQEEFIEAARDFREDLFGEPDSTLRVHPGEWLDGLDYADWLRDPARRYGDVTTADFVNGTYVIYFIDRDPNDYNMVNMRQILISRENVQIENFDGVDDPIFQDLIYQVEREASQRANAVLDLFIAGGATEELLIELMAEHSDDTTPGGLYEDISKVATQSKLVSEIEEWLFAPGRQVGDFELIRTADFGYHLVYVTGFGMNYRDFIADSRMRTRDHTAWLESIGVFTGGMADEELQQLRTEVTRHWAFRFTQS